MDILSAGIGGAAATAFFGSIAALLKRSVTQLDKKLESHDEALKEQSKALEAYKLHAEQHFVTSDELTKAIGNLEGTIQRLIESVNSNASEMREWFRVIQQTKADKP
jgi:uncharacterized membrane-anchored protein YhcB (DUF1043 family)